MKIIICEDEERQRHILARSLESWSNSRQIELELLSFESGEELEFKKEEHLDADLYILDIEMKNQSGMDVAKWIREWNKESGIMFITGYEHFVFEGYLVKAIAYILKPYRQEQLEQCLDRLYEEIKEQRNFFVCKTTDGGEKIFFEDIVWIQSDDHYVLIQTQKNQVRGRCSLEEVKRELNDRNFLQPHRSFVIANGKIKRIGRSDIEMTDGSLIPIARGKWEQINEQYMDYVRKMRR